MTKTKDKKFKLELYARDGETLYDVSKYKNIVNVLTASMPIIVEMHKAQTLPHKVFVVYEDLVELNKMIFGIERGQYFKLYLSNSRNAQAVLIFDDVKLASQEDLYHVSEDNKIEEVIETDLEDDPANLNMYGQKMR